jgi:DNA polymerase-3 subunit beta
MKFTVKKGDILHVLANVQGITGRKTNLAITVNVLMKAEADAVSILATDLETGFQGVYPATVETDGVIAINSRKLFEIVKEFPSEDIHFSEVQNNWVRISDDKVEYHLVGMNAEDFPDIPQIKDTRFEPIDSAAFKKMIECATIVSAPSEDKRAHITGSYFENREIEEQPVVRLVSTDGSRLSVSETQVSHTVELPNDSGVLIPKKGLTEVGRFLDPGGMVNIGFQEANFIVKKNQETIIIRLLEGDFPRYDEIIAKGDGHALTIEKKPFIQMLRRMSILSSESYKGVIFNFEDNRLNITSTNPDIGESREDLAIDFSGDPIQVAFNPKFFIDSLNMIEEDSVLLSIVDEEKPCLIEGSDDKNYISVIMPMRL